jgi:uncharacterized surface anchored protein
VRLEGSRFELYDKLEKMLLETLVTDANGEAVSKKTYRYGEYFLKEVKEPDGYIPDGPYFTGEKIKFTTGSEEFVITNVKGDWSFELTKVDAEDGSTIKEEAVFKLQLKNSSW